MNTKFLSELLELKKNSIVSVSGSGGKTTFCKTLSLELFEVNEFLNNKVSVLFSTTTKIKDFDDKQYLKILYDKDYTLKDLKIIKGLYLIAKKEEAHKLSSLPLEILEKITSIFTYSILEADGSKRKPLKAWNKNEPVYFKNTTHSIGIIPIKSLNLEINDKNIHRLEIFQKKFNIGKKLKVDIDLLEEIILNKNGLFKNALGEKILFINQVETEDEIELAQILAKKIKIKKSIDKIIIGSLHNKNYELI